MQSICEHALRACGCSATLPPHMARGVSSRQTSACTRNLPDAPDSSRDRGRGGAACSQSPERGGGSTQAGRDASVLDVFRYLPADQRLRPGGGGAGAGDVILGSHLDPGLFTIELCPSVLGLGITLAARPLSLSLSPLPPSPSLQNDERAMMQLCCIRQYATPL